MLRFIPVFILMGVFAVIGLYWAVLTRHFIDWASKYNESFQKIVGGSSQSRVQVAEAQPASSSTFLTWGIRLIGVALAGIALVTIIRTAVTGG
jgi:hypothetical protein